MAPIDSHVEHQVERYELAEQASGEGIWDWDLQSGALYLSSRFKQLLGLRGRGSFCHIRDWVEQVHAEDRVWLDACFEAQRGSTVALPFILEHRIRNTDHLQAQSTTAAATDDDDHAWRWLVGRGVAVHGPDGHAVRMVGSVTDITERKIAEIHLRRSEERYALAAAASNDGLYDWDLRTDTIYYSPRWKALLGYATTEIGSAPDEWFTRVLPEDLIWLQATLDAQVGAGGKPFQMDYRMRDAYDRVRWMSCRGIAVLDAFGEPVRVVGSQADITERKLTEQELRQSEERYALAARGANDGLWDWQIARDTIYFSPRWKEMLGHTDDDLGDRPEEWFDRVLPEDAPGLQAAIHLHLDGHSDHLEHEFRMRHADGRERWFLVRALAVRNNEERAVRLTGSMTDITRRKEAEQQLLFDAFHDGLTALPNRQLLLDRIGQALDRQRHAGGRHFAVLLLDLDRFQTINDSLGTYWGDEMLRRTGHRLELGRRAGDTVARLSADEFALLLADAEDLGPALDIAQDLAAKVMQPVMLGERDAAQEVVLTASVGIALSISGYDRPEDMLRDASLALVRAKSSGRSRIEVFDTKLRETAMRQLRMESELRTAIDQHQLVLFYQPIVDLNTRCIAGFEALMRWQHPERGMVSPVDFIPLAEESGLIIPMGRWALQEASRQIAHWQTRFPRPDPLFMSVNTSSQQYTSDDLIHEVQEVLRSTRIPPTSLKLELTESLLMDDSEQSGRVMRSIREMDVRLSIDDFGTGYSSLNYLHRYPVDILKIDRSFVSAIGASGNKAAIVHVIATLATILNLDVVAEGIENELEADFLRDVNCRFGQGFLFYRPMPAPDIERILEKEQATLPS